MLFLAGLFFFISCESDSQRNMKGGLKDEICAIAKKIVAKKVNHKGIRFAHCAAKNVIFWGNGRYEVNSYIELPELSGKLLQYNYYVVLKYKHGDADKTENWDVEKVFIEVFAD